MAGANVERLPPELPLVRRAHALEHALSHAHKAGMITYSTHKEIDLEQFIDVFRRSTLGERRPIHDRSIMQAMLQHADVLVTAWEGPQMVGLARTLTDYAYVAYLADLAVDTSYQRKGIGKELIQRTQAELEPTCFITLLAAPKANDYYPALGFVHNPRAWMKHPQIGA